MMTARSKGKVVPDEGAALERIESTVADLPTSRLPESLRSGGANEGAIKFEAMMSALEDDDEENQKRTQGGRKAARRQASTLGTDTPMRRQASALHTSPLSSGGTRSMTAQKELSAVLNAQLQKQNQSKERDRLLNFRDETVHLRFLEKCYFDRKVLDGLAVKAMVVTAMYVLVIIGMWQQDMLADTYDIILRLTIAALMGVLSYMTKTATADKAERVQLLVMLVHFVLCVQWLWFMTISHREFLHGTATAVAGRGDELTATVEKNPALLESAYDVYCKSIYLKSDSPSPVPSLLPTDGESEFNHIQPSPSPTETTSEPELTLRLLWVLKTRTSYLHFFFLTFFTFIAARVLRLRFKFVLGMGFSHFNACWLLHYTLMPQYDEIDTWSARMASRLFIGDGASWFANMGFVVFLVYGAYETESELQSFFLSKGFHEMQYFCDRFKVPSKTPEHVSSTCMVIRGVDTGFAGDGREDDVVIKLMKYEDQFLREISARKCGGSKGLDPEMIVPILATSQDPDLAPVWEEQVHTKLMPGRDFNFGLIMPAAHRNLMVVLLQERVDLDETKHIVRQLSRCLLHLHENGVIHGDFKPLNAVRMPGGVQWSLIDLDAAVRKGTPIALKTSTAFCPPELTAAIVAPDHGIKKGKGGSYRGTGVNRNSGFDIRPKRLSGTRLSGARRNRSSFNSNSSFNSRDSQSLESITSSDAIMRQKEKSSGSHRRIASMEDVQKGGFTSSRNELGRAAGIRPSDATRIVFRMPEIDHRANTDEVVPKAPEGAGYELLMADPSYDIWSMGVVFYRIITRRHLFETDDQDNLSKEADKRTLHDWNAHSLSDTIMYTSNTLRSNDTISDMNRLLACDLLAWLLQRHPGSRPSSFREMMHHPFLALGEKYGEDDVDTQAWRIPQLHVLAALNKTEEAVPLLESCAQKEGSINTGDPLLGRSALHMAATEGHLDFVKLLLKQPHINVDSRDGSGNTVLLTILSLMDSSRDWIDKKQEKRMLAVLETLCSVADLTLRDSAGRECFDFGWHHKDVRAILMRLQKDRLVVGKMKAFEPFDPEKFMDIWDYDESSLESCRTRGELEDVLWEVLSWALTRGNKFANKAGKRYINENIFTLDIWDEHSWDKLQKLATQKSEEIVAESFRIRDRDILGKPDGVLAASFASFGTIRHPLPTGMLEDMKKLAKTTATSNELDEVVFVDLIRTLAVQATDIFKEKVERCLGENCEVASFSPGDWPEDLDAAPKMVFFANVKGAQRMKVKVAEYRAEAEGGKVDDAEEGGPSEETADGLLRKKSVKMGMDLFLRGQNLGAKLRGAGWPYVQKLGDCLRCTVDCETATEMLETWEQLKAEFDISDDCDKYPMGHGRLKNNLNTSELKPPDMLVNVVFDAGGYEMVGEVQIHLRAIHRLKQQNHFPYEISRAPDINALIGGVSHEVAKLKHELAIQEQEHMHEVLDMKLQIDDLHEHEMELMARTHMADVATSVVNGKPTAKHPKERRATNRKFSMFGPFGAAI